MKPGHGEILLAEGDVAVREDEERLVEEFRRQLELDVGSGSGRRRRRAARGADGARLRRCSARRRSRDLLPARGRRALSEADDAARARSATLIVIVALLWEVALADGRRGARSATARAAPRVPQMDFDPGRERRAEQRARQLLRSCVNHEEWEMYRDLGCCASGAR